MQELIFEKCRQLKLGVNGLFSFHDWNNMKYSLNPKERDEFEKCFEQLVEIGVFIAERLAEQAYQYRLTEKGYLIVYQDIRF